MTEDKRDTRRKELRRQQRLVLAVVALPLAALVVPQVLRYALRDSNAAPGTVQLPPPLRPSPAGQYRGLTLQLHSSSPQAPYEQYVREIAQTGANTICLSVAAYQENGSSSSVIPDARRVPPRERMVKLVRLARELRLRVVLMPIVLLENPGEGEWRGKIRPTHPGKWWEDYENYVLDYARLAQETGAEVLIVGSELISLESETERWRTLIREVRGAYRGQLSYSANWDHYWVPKFWDDLDIVGMTSYYDLVGEKKPSLEVLLASWRGIRKDILKWQRKINRPILFTEVGWPSLEGCAKAPWDYTVSARPDPVTQDLCFQAFFRTWRNEPASTVAGVLIWEWRSHPGQKGGPEDTSYIPIGKPAMKTIQAFFQSPGAAPTTGSAPATAPAGDTAPATGP